MENNNQQNNSVELSSDTLRKCISILIEMKRNHIEYKKAFGMSYPGVFQFQLKEYPPEPRVDQKVVTIEYLVDTDKYRITTLFDGKTLFNDVSANQLPVTTVISLFQLFQNQQSYWIAYEQFFDQQYNVLKDIKPEFILDRLKKYMIAKPDRIATIYSSIKLVGMSFELHSTDNFENYPEFFKQNGITYYNIYTSLFFNINKY